MGELQVRGSERTKWQAVGEMFRFIKDPLGTFVYLQRTWGDVVRLPLPGPKTVQFTLPEHVGAVLRLPVKDQTTRSMVDIMGQGLLTAAGAEWRRNRRMITPAFSQKSIAPFLDTICNLTELWLNKAPEVEGELDLTEEMLGLTLDVILKTVFGGAVDVNRAQVAAGMEEYFYQFFLDNGSWRRLVPPFIMTPGRRRRVRAMRDLEAVVYSSIEQRRKLPPGDDLLYFMLQAKDEEGQSLPDRSLRDEVLTLILAGHETTAEMLTYALWLLSRRPELQAQLQAEIRDKVGMARPTRETLAECKLLSAVLEEALRLYPPAYVVAREAHEACEIGGCAISKGNQLLVPAWVIHRDPRWWREPDAFRPERWLNGETADLPANAYFPFGGGPRLCIGRHFALFEGSVILLSLLQRLSFRPVDSYQLELMQSVTLRPRHGIRLRVAPVGQRGRLREGNRAELPSSAAVAPMA